MTVHPGKAFTGACGRYGRDPASSVAKTLLDFMRRELAVQVGYLDATKQRPFSSRVVSG